MFRKYQGGCTDSNESTNTNGLQRLIKNCLVIISSEEMRKGGKQNQNNPVITKRKKVKIWFGQNAKTDHLKRIPESHHTLLGRPRTEFFHRHDFKVSCVAESPGSFSCLFVWLLALPEGLLGKWPCTDGVQSVWGTLGSHNALLSVIILVTWQKLGKEERAHLSHEKYNGKSKLPTYRTKSLLSLTTLILSLQDTTGEREC